MRALVSGVVIDLKILIYIVHGHDVDIYATVSLHMTKKSSRAQSLGPVARCGFD